MRNYQTPKKKREIIKGQKRDIEDMAYEILK